MWFFYVGNFSVLGDFFGNFAIKIDLQINCQINHQNARFWSDFCPNLNRDF